MKRSRRSLIILEQEKTIRQSLSNLMEAYQQFEVFTANTRREALSLFHGVSFDRVLCGHWLPDGDGLELLKKFMRQSPRLISVLMTVHGDDLSRQKAARAGIRGYLEKTFDLKQLEEAIGWGLRPHQ